MLGELRPVMRHLPVEIQQAVLDQQGDHHGRHAFGTGVRTRNGVRGHARTAGEAYHPLSAVISGKLGAVARIFRQEGFEQFQHVFVSGRYVALRSLHFASLPRKRFPLPLRAVSGCHLFALPDRSRRGSVPERPAAE